MNRIALMVCKNIFRVPGLYTKLRKYAKTVGTYPEAEAYAHIRSILRLGVESGNINMHVTGQENIPTDGGFILYSNHQGLFDVVAIVVACETPISAVYKKEIEIKTGGIYRSLHYIIKYRGYYVEIQGRTLFEEGWGEVDHDIVYPHHQDDEMLTDFSTLLNRLSGMADEMSSYFRKMKDEIEKK